MTLKAELHAVIVYSSSRLYSNFHVYHPERNNIPQGGFIPHLQFAEHLQSHLNPVINLYRDKTI